MMQKLVKCAVVGGLVLFVWGMISWVVLPWHKMHMMSFKNDEKVMDVIKDNASESGIYILPNCSENQSHSDMMKNRDMMMKGPFVFAAVSMEGKNPDMTASMVKGFLLKVIAAFIVSWMLMQTRLNYQRQVGFVTIVGLLIGLTGVLPYWIWFGFPGGFAIATIFEAIVGWFFAGLVIAKMIR
jgi:hypothetical protein